MKRKKRAMKSFAGMIILLMTISFCICFFTQNAFAAPKIKRLVIGMVPPKQEGNSPSRDLTPPQTWQLRPMYEYLIGTDPKSGMLVPQLATKWQIEPDGKSYRFMLRKGIQFHGGYGEFTAKDVAFSLSQIMKDDALNANANMFRRIVAGTTIINDYEIVINLNYPGGDFLYGISEQSGGVEMQSKAHHDAMGKDKPSLVDKPFAGTGAYEFLERRTSSYIRFKRVPYKHWRAQAGFEEIEFRFQKEASTRLAALLSKEIHMANLPSDLIPQALKAGYKRFKSQFRAIRIGIAFFGCYIDKNNPSGLKYPDSPLTDVRVRKALSKAINRKELIDGFLGGDGEIIYGPNHFNHKMPGIGNAAWKERFEAEYGYDPKAAKALLAEAGQSKMSTTYIDYYSGSFPPNQDVIEAVVGYFKAIGVDAKILSVPGPQKIKKMRQLKWKNHLHTTITSSNPFLAIRIFNSGVLARGYGAESPEADAIHRKLMKEIDPAKQNALFRQWADIAYDKHLSIPLFSIHPTLVGDPTIVNSYTFPGSDSGIFNHVETITPTEE